MAKQKLKMKNSRRLGETRSLGKIVSPFRPTSHKRGGDRTMGVGKGGYGAGFSFFFFFFFFFFSFPPPPPPRKFFLPTPLDRTTTLRRWDVDVGSSYIVIRVSLLTRFPPVFSTDSYFGGILKTRCL